MAYVADAVTLSSTMHTDRFELASSALTSSTLKWLHRIQCVLALSPSVEQLKNESKTYFFSRRIIFIVPFKFTRDFSMVLLQSKILLLHGNIAVTKEMQQPLPW
jgi:hypothetical protein